MDVGFGIVSLIVLLLVIGAVLGWVAFLRTGSLRDRLRQLEKELARLEPLTGQAAPRSRTYETPQPESAATREPARTPAVTAPSVPPGWGNEAQRETGEPAGTARRRDRWLAVLMDNWMIWLGGISVALAGVFMVRYSIEIGLLGPRARIMLALLTGLSLHGAAEWFRRRAGGSDPVFAALAGGASITLYAALLAALHLYHLLDPHWVFVLLALVSLATMVLSLVHGPILAIIGLIGAYVVPILVSTGSGNVVIAMIYSLIISAAALVLLRYVFRYWLWWGIMAGSLGWWLISLGNTQADTFRGLYLALFAWGMVALPVLDWFLRARKTSAADRPEPGSRTLFESGHRIELNQLGLLLVILAWGYSIFRQGFTADALGLWAPLVAVICLAARWRDSLAALPWATLLVQWLAWFLSAVSFDGGPAHLSLTGLPLTEQPQFLAYAGFMALLYAGLALLQLWERGYSHSWMSLALLAPLAWLALAYLLVNGIAQSVHWSVVTFLGGMAYGTMAGILLQRHVFRGAALWFTLGAHLAYSLAVAMYFREASLSLALSAQVLSLTWLMKRHGLPWLGNLIKGLLAIIVIRLTFNPWLLGYPVDVHWSLWTYGGTTLFCALASLQCRSNPAMQKWLEAATLHLLVLTLGAEVRYWLYDGAVFAHRYSLKEAAINTSLWAAMALTYHHRSRISEHLEPVYRLGSRILLMLSAASYGIAVVIHNPWWSPPSISTTPVYNLLLLSYGLPVIMALLIARYHERQFRRPALGIAGLGALLFVTLEIRHLWQDGKLALSHPTGDGELYTYSIIWLLMAVAAILAGASWRMRDLYRAGMALLVVVIAKIFLVDMSDLEGLLRVASFMGLGLSLLGLAWLHRRIRYTAAAASNGNPTSQGA